MDENFENEMMNNLMKKDDKNNEEFGDFLKRVDEIQSLVKGMASKDEKVVKDSMEKADDILKNLPKKSKIKKTNSDDDEVSSDEVEDADDVTDGRGDGDGKKKKKKTFNKTVINDKAFKEEVKKDSVPSDQAGFMKAVEEDAMKRAEERKKKKEEARVWKEKGETLFNEGSFKEALEAFDKALGTFKDWPALWTGRALTHLQLGHLDKALHDCDWAFRSDEKSLNAHVTMSRIRRSQGQHSEAVSVLKKALKFHPSKKTLINKYIVEATLEQANEREKNKEKS